MDIFYPLQLFADFISYSIFSLTPESSIGHAVHFFIYDSLKIILLLLVITQLMSFINIVFPVDKIRKILVEKKLYGLEYFFASLFGTITPFCSCSSIPLFIGFLKGGIPLGITFSFLITSPLVNEVAIALFLGIFGLKTTLIYMTAGIILGTLGGFILGKLKLEKYIEPFIWDIANNNNEVIETKKDWKQIWKQSSKEGLNITKKIIPYVLIGISIGAVIHGYVPEGFFTKYVGTNNIFAVPLSVILGIPMYADASSIVPIMKSLIDKGVPLGTGLAFMMSVVGLSFPEFLILKKVMKIKLLLIFFSLIGFFIIILGYFFNAIL